MAIEAVNRIKAAEDEGEALIRRARAEARDGLRRAGTEGARRAGVIAAEASEQRLSLLAQAEAEAARAVKPLAAKGEEDIARILHPDVQAFDETVRAVIHLVTEGIVGTDGHR